MSIKRKLLTALGVATAVIAVAVGAFFIAYNTGLYTAASGPPPEIVIRGGTLFDGTGAPPVENARIVLRDGVIACIGAACEATAAAIEIDATDLAIVPGLIDLHGHFLGRREATSLPSLIWDTMRLRPAFRRQLLESGVMSFRDVGGPRDAILEIKRALNARELAGPRIFVAGPLFTAPGGHPAYGGRDPNRSGVGGLMTFQSNDPEAVRNEVAVLASQGVDGIKAVFHGNAGPEGQPSLPTISSETLLALTQAAREHGLWVAVHAGPLHESAVAARSGATTIEHGVRNGNVIDDATLRALVDNDVVYVPTLGVEPGAEVNIPALFAAGVMIGVGTDAEDYHEELTRLADAGMPASAVLVAATFNGARALRRSDMLGTVEQGKLADLVLVNGAPWNDIRDLQSVALVIQSGFVVFDERSTR
jgi:enamidase